MVWSSANLPLSFNGAVRDRVPAAKREQAKQQRDVAMRKLIAFDDDTADKLKQLARDRMATFQELADEAFADLLKKHGIPLDLRNALRTSARESDTAVETKEEALRHLAAGHHLHLPRRPHRGSTPRIRRQNARLIASAGSLVASRCSVPGQSRPTHGSAEQRALSRPCHLCIISRTKIDRSQGGKP